MGRNIPNPLHPGILHLRIGIESFGDSMGDKRGALFFQQFDEAGFLGDQGVDASSFAVEYGSDNCLLRQAWEV